jgi:hypothetical protein
MGSRGGWDAAQAAAGLGAATLGMAFPGTAKGVQDGVDEMVTLYHGTTKEAAERIKKSGYMKSAGEPRVYFTTDPKGAGYGDGSVVAVQVPKSRLEIDDEFPGGRVDYSVDVKKPGGGMAVKVLPDPFELAPGGQNALSGIRAYHGSPHDFDAFSMDKIGTGEGAQAYGHGLYFAESEGVAKSYRDNLSARLADDDHSPGGFLKRALDWSKGDRAKAAEDLRAQIASSEAGMRAMEGKGVPVEHPAWMTQLGRHGAKREALEMLERGDEPGRMYEVRINASPDDFLDWDKPLSEQSEKVRAGYTAARGDMAEIPPGLESRSGESALMDVGLISGERNPYAGASQRFREAGIPGIRYLDQGSRTAGDGSRNYVVFDEKLVQIMKKYGWMLPTAGVGLSFGSDE